MAKNKKKVSLAYSVYEKLSADKNKSKKVLESGNVGLDASKVLPNVDFIDSDDIDGNDEYLKMLACYMAEEDGDVNYFILDIRDGVVFLTEDLDSIEEMVDELGIPSDIDTAGLYDFLVDMYGIFVKPSDAPVVEMKMVTTKYGESFGSVFLEGEWAVYSDYEADKAARESIENSIEDMGVDAAEKWVWEEHLSMDILKREAEYWYSEGNAIYSLKDLMLYTDTDEEELAEMFDLEEWDEEAKSEHGDEAWDKLNEMYIEERLDEIESDPTAWIDENNMDITSFVDTEAMIQSMIDVDGRGHFLSGYDGDEIEVSVGGEDFFCYRTN